ncbi:MAG: hypothetical protein INF43_00150, partial [Alphaproteobacteria bacterium]|nr:hypothetical protein [Alphaproteobacteria bacterium]
MRVTSAALPAAHPAVSYGLLADLVLAGVAFELQTTPAAWREAGRPMLPVTVPEPVQPKPLPPAAAPAHPPVPTEPVTAWRVWQAGEGGGVAVVLAAPGPCGVAEVQLLENMLRAVGLPTAPVAYVGLAGV